MPLPPLPLVEKAAGMDIEETSPRMLAKALDLESALEFCAAYRRIAVCRLLMTGLPDRYFSFLAMSAQAFHFYLRHAREDEKALSRSAPFLDALACGGLAAARELVRVSRRTWNADIEYEEDFIYFDVLMGLVSEPPASPRQLERGLARYGELAAGQEDFRLGICRALIDRDAEGFDEVLSRQGELKYRQYRKALAAGQLFPDDAASTELVWIEGLALVWVARHVGMEVHPGELLMPSPALSFSRVHPPSPDAWLHVGSYRELD
ncbi:Imm49 family immunity protein [Corallococcus terminator]